MLVMLCDDSGLSCTRGVAVIRDIPDKLSNYRKHFTFHYAMLSQLTLELNLENTNNKITKKNKLVK